MSKIFRVCIFSVLILALMVSVSDAAYKSKTKLFRDLLLKEQATIGDAIQFTARYKGYEKDGTIDDELAFLKEKGIDFGPDVKKILDTQLTKGGATHLLMKALGVKGGIMYRLFPDKPRYALREAVNLGFLKRGSNPIEKMSGRDLLGVMVKVVGYTDERIEFLAEKKKAAAEKAERKAKWRKSRRR